MIAAARAFPLARARAEMRAGTHAELSFMSARVSACGVRARSPAKVAAAAMMRRR